MDAATVAHVLAKSLPEFAEPPAEELQVTPSHDTEWHQVYFVSNGRSKVVVSVPSWSGTELLSKTLAETALAGLGPNHIATLNHDGHVLLVNEFLEDGTLQSDDLNADILEQLGSLYARLHKVNTSWFEPVREKLVQEGVFTSSESDWAFCLWVLPRFLRYSAGLGIFSASN